MNFSPEETETLRTRLLVVLEPFTEADPDALLDFILLFINKGSSRDELKETYKNELEVFCEENTNKAVEAVFKVIDDIISARETATSAATKESTAVPSITTSITTSTSNTTAGQKREKEESEDEDDDDRNFKRRNMNPEDDVRDIPPAAAAAASTPTTTTRAEPSSSSTKRKSPDDGVQSSQSERPAKVSRSPEQERVLATLPEHLRKRLGNRDGTSPQQQQQQQQQEPRARQPCRHFEEHGYCLYGDNCKFDHGQNVAVADYSNFQAMFSTPGSAAMTNPMMMNMAGQITPYNMTTTPYGFQNPINNSLGDQSAQQLLSQQQQWQLQNKKPQHFQQQSQHNNGTNYNNTTHQQHPQRQQQQQPQEIPYTTRYTKTSTRLVIEKIPTEACTIDSVTETFKKFGTIVDIELQPENQRAFLEFKTHDEALKAHQSPEVLFNNRFVKVYWRKESPQQLQKQQEQAYQQQQQEQSAEPDPEIVKQRAAELAKKREEQQRRKKEQLEKQIEYNKKKQEIARRNLELAMLKAKVAEMEA
ncbi:hypothetical protein INT45_012821, partial [Circinella minor]